MTSSLFEYNPGPTQELVDPVLDKAGVRLLVRREDLNHPSVSGNKWWKLKYNIAMASANGQKLLTFGGAYSNHIYATAAAANECKLESIGIIRGEKITPLNPTLAFAESCGMRLHYISRQAYRERSNPRFVQDLKERFGDFFLIPEGGTNALALKGCAELAAELLKTNFDMMLVAVGTGGTLAGLVAGFRGARQIVGVPVLKDALFLNKSISDLITAFSDEDYGNWSLLTSYHHGGYAKVTTSLLEFIRAMRMKHNLPLDHVYTAKMMWALFREAESGAFRRGTTILALHTGGLQGSIRLFDEKGVTQT